MLAGGGCKLFVTNVSHYTLPGATVSLAAGSPGRSTRTVQLASSLILLRGQGVERGEPASRFRGDVRADNCSGLEGRQVITDAVP